MSPCSCSKKKPPVRASRIACSSSRKASPASSDALNLSAISSVNPINCHPERNDVERSETECSRGTLRSTDFHLPSRFEHNLMRPRLLHRRCAKWNCEGGAVVPGRPLVHVVRTEQIPSLAGHRVQSRLIQI